MRICKSCGEAFDGDFCPKCGAAYTSGGFCPHCGKRYEGDARYCAACGKDMFAPAQPTEAAAAPTQQTVTVCDSTFTGGAFANYFITLLTVLASTLSLGIALPWMMCWRERWMASHTYVNGRRLRFDGTGGQLFGKYIIWLLLSLITLGIYGAIVLPVRLARWKTEHTHFEGNADPEATSYFNGTCLGYFGMNLLTAFVTTITFSFGFYWAYCYRQRWFVSHQAIDGHALDFDGKGIQFFGKCICWVLLTLITFGIYSFWLTVKIKRWTVLHTNAVDQQALTAPIMNGTARMVTVSGSGTPSEPAKSRAGLICGIVGLLTQIFPVSIVGLVLSIKNKDTAGKVVSIIGVVIGILIMIAYTGLMVFMLLREGPVGIRPDYLRLLRPFAAA